MCARKTWGGNRTDAGAREQQILVSVLRTCRQQKDPFRRLVGCSARPPPSVSTWCRPRTPRNMPSTPAPGSLTFCGRTFSAADLALIGEVAADCGPLGLTEIARTSASYSTGPAAPAG